jgi:acyl carrier protein
MPRAMWMERLHVTDDRQLKDALKELIIRECDSDLSASDIPDDAPLLGEALGFDSLDALQICMAVQARYGVRIEGGRETRRALRSIDALAETIRAGAGR